jgi:hypothetical protein
MGPWTILAAVLMIVAIVLAATPTRTELATVLAICGGAVLIALGGV